MTTTKTYHKYFFIAILFIIAWQIFCISVLFANKTDCFPSLCADGQTRAVLGAKWIRAPFFMNEGYTRNSIWLPLPYWLIGVGLTICYSLYWIPIIINLICGAALLLMLYNISRVLFNDRITGLIELLLVGFIPWFVWLSISGMSEPLSFLLIIAGFFFYLAWIKQISRVGFLWCAGGVLTLANMARNENWIVSGLLTAAIIVACFINKNLLREKKYRLPFLLVLIAPWVFPLAWTIAQAKIFHAFNLYYYYRKVSGCTPISEIKMSGVLARRFFIFFQSASAASIPIFALSFCGAVAMILKKQKLAVIYLALVLSYSIFLLGVFLSGAIPGLRERVPLILVLLISPFAAYTVRKIFSIRLRAYAPKILIKTILTIGVFIFVMSNISTSSNFPAPYKEMAIFSSIGQKLKILWEDGILGKDDKIIIIPPQKDFMQKDAILSYNVISAYSNHPFNIFVIEEWMEREKVSMLIDDAKIIAVQEDFYNQYQDHVKKISRLLFRVGDYAVFLIK